MEVLLDTVEETGETMPINVAVPPVSKGPLTQHPEAVFDEELDRFQKLLSKIDHGNLDSFKDEFFRRVDRISDMIEHGPNPEAQKEKFFRVCGALDRSVMHERTRWKPLGYAGDYQLIDWIYTKKTADSGSGKAFDMLYHTYEAAEAVRNRKEYFIRLCVELAKASPSGINVLNLGCGSCRDVLEVGRNQRNGRAVHFHCVDQEPKAIEYARSLISGTGAEPFVRLEYCNLFRFRSAKAYNLIWSAGLFDYLDKRMATLLVRRFWRNLRPGGWFVFGNFSPANPTRKGMELVGKWFLLHRTAEELIELVNDARVPYTRLEVDSESLGINLFCKIQK